MTPHPPHLPPKTCHVGFQKQWQRIVGVVAMVLLAFLAGIAATMVTIAWIAPVRSTLPILIQTGAQRSADTLAPEIMQQVRQRTLTMYDTRLKTHTSFYSDDDAIGQAVILTRDGWSILYAPSYVRGAERTWEAIDHQGTSYRIDEVLADPLGGIIYIHIATGTFRGDIRFAEDDERKENAMLWQVNEQGSSAVALGPRTLIPGVPSELFAIWEPRYAYTLAEEIAPGSLLVTNDGAFAGFADAHGQLLSSWRIEEQLPKLFAEQKLEYTGLPLIGSPVSRVRGENGWKDISGFYVSRALPMGTSTPFRAGDVVLSVDGDQYAPQQTPMRLLRAQEELRVTILRAGQEQNVTVRKVRVGR